MRFQVLLPILKLLMWAIEALQVTAGRPNTYDDSHQRGAVREPSKPLFLEKIDFMKYLKPHDVLYINSYINQVTLYNSKKILYYYSF